MSDAEGDVAGAEAGDVAGPEAEEATGAEGETTADCGGRPCPRCETPMYHRHCKYVCPAHGVVYDCSDTFY